tara:strand:- start:6706 stop:7281 length:576 start_codon:yes stop_codon:yes gene_type:complete
MVWFRLTARADSSYFQRNRFRPEYFGTGCVAYCCGYRRIGQLENIAANAADKKHTRVMLAHMGATDKRVKRGYTMYQPVLLQKIQCSVYRWGCCVVAFSGKLCEYIVGPEGFVGLPDQLQYSLSGGCQAGTLLLTDRPGVGQSLADTGIVVVRAVRERTGGHGRDPAFAKKCNIITVAQILLPRGTQITRV